MKNKVINLFGDKKNIENKDVKYSSLLEKFMDPFKNDFSEMEYLEDIFDLTISAWNFGNMSIFVVEKEEKEEFKKIIASSSLEQNVSVTLLTKMINYKVANFKEYPHFIIDYEFEGTSGDRILKVITQSEKSYLSTIVEDLENENTPYDFEENYINRQAIVIKPLQPFIDWHNSLHPDTTIDETDLDDVNTYLINDQIDDIEIWLKKRFDKFFMLELEDWHTNKKEWPQKRNYKMFKEWFQVQTSSMIYDLEKESVFKLE